ncbi:transposable element Tcb2 transposase [Trichonephila clavipes]|uniref:Transposable element Tcb2 transposase n=1 Tax=Trichonephila clavipes TaxID=2585209 RepID=A0A8X6W1I4_TRICX|nr:transposable element Tcb2 transposase [Trichonephila clavipes]
MQSHRALSKAAFISREIKNPEQSHSESVNTLLRVKTVLITREKVSTAQIPANPVNKKFMHLPRAGIPPQKLSRCFQPCGRPERLSSSTLSLPSLKRRCLSKACVCDYVSQPHTGFKISIWNRFFETGSTGRRPGQGRRRATTLNEDRYLVLTARRHRNRNATLLQQHLRSATGTRVSTQTVRNRLHGVGPYARQPMVCVRLTSRYRRDRPQGVGNRACELEEK